VIETPRTEAPQCLKENYKYWGKEYKGNLEANPNYSFHWHSRRDEIEDALFLMTANHCSFCDIQPLRASGATIEHFRPKNSSILRNKFPLLAYYWGNLFYCCSNCQKKGTRFSRNLLKPDKISYSFRHYFIYNYSTGIIDPNPARSVDDREKAKITIDLYGLNKWGRPDERVKERNCFLEDRELGKNKDIKDYSYRFILH
jgi:uncharacterized protein (TIGR02646 family)